MLWALADLRLVHIGRTVPLREGDLVLVDRLLPVTLSGEADWSACLIDLGSRRIADLLGKDRRFVAAPLHRDGPASVAIKRLCDLAMDMDQLGADDVLAHSGLASVMTNLVGGLASTSFDWKVSRHSAAMLDRARQHIRTHFSDYDFDVSALAAKMGISARHLSSVFAEAGTTIARDIGHQRMQHASALLADRANGKRQILEIARACGFADQTQFGRCFKRQFGATPRDFRRRMTPE